MRVSSQKVTVVALLADPAAPTEIAQRMAGMLPDRLADRAGQGRSTTRRVNVDRSSVPAVKGSLTTSTSNRRYLRVLLGMVRANRPWRLVPGLSKALAAALATGAVATVNSTIWTLATYLSTPRLVIAMVGSVALMIGWLIVDASLWQTTDEVSPEARKRAALYNASTIVTVGLGVILCYVGLMVINLVWALFILNDRVFASTTRTPLHATEYWTSSWFVASVATVGGALGSGLESDEAIRAAAYSKRAQERRSALQDDHGD
ncbi:hypothetical protein [Streptomyces sp. AM6-12]|uniref:hypothetical protein n=1 Tax=Streptomyces sp. AM6-12 TaxID=3345149 RepID=UPI00379437B7